MASELRFADVRRVLEQHGWTLVRINGSHHVFAKAGEPSIIVLPVHKGRVPPNYVRDVEKTLGVKVR